MSGGPFNLIATTDAVTSYSATRLYSGTTYTFRVMAIDAANNQSAMRATTLTTSASSDTTVPAAPSSGQRVLPRLLQLPDRCGVGCVLVKRRRRLPGASQRRAGGPVDLPNTPRFSDNGLDAATSYSYMIQAVDSAGNLSALTTAKSAKTLAAGSVIIARGPYLSNVTSTSGVVSWWTNLATPGTVTINGQTVTDPAGCCPAPRGLGERPCPRARSYPYTVTSGTATASGTLDTAASPGQTFSFAAIGDFGGGSTGETQNAANIAGCRHRSSSRPSVTTSTRPPALPDPNFSTTYSDFDQRFFKPFATAIKSQAFFPANGNKEYYGDGEFWDAFPMPGSNHSWYSYNWGDAHILVLDSEQPFARAPRPVRVRSGGSGRHQVRHVADRGHPATAIQLDHAPTRARSRCSSISFRCSRRSTSSSCSPATATTTSAPTR